MNEYQEKLKAKMDRLAHLVYQITRDYPKNEIYGLVSQMRRAAVSIVLNYIEGYARRKRLVRLNFLEISNGSLQELKYLLSFSLQEGLVAAEDIIEATDLTKEIGAMLWTEITNIDRMKK